MKSIEKKYNIINKYETNNKRVIDNTEYYLIGNYLLTRDDVDYGRHRYNYFTSIKMEELKRIDKEGNIDIVFKNIFNSKKMVINEKEYDSSEIYIVKDNNGVYLIKAGEEKDLLTGKSIDLSNTKKCLFKSSSIFYELYKSGIIKEPIVIDTNIEISNWDTKKSNALPMLEADNIATKKYKEKFEFDISSVDYYELDDGTKVYPMLKTIIDNITYIVFVNEYKDYYNMDELYVAKEINNELTEVNSSIIDTLIQLIKKNM